MDAYSDIPDQLNKEEALNSLNGEKEAAITVVKNYKNDIISSE